MISLNEDGTLPWTVLTNYPNQGTGADVVAIARVSLNRRLKERKFNSVLVGTVHDDIRIDCPDEETNDVAQLCYDVFDDIPLNIKRLWGIEVPLKFPGEVFKGKNFRELEVVPRVKYQH